MATPVELWVKFPNAESELGKAIAAALDRGEPSGNPGLVFDKIAGVLIERAYQRAVHQWRASGAKPAKEPNRRDQKSAVLKELVERYQKWAQGERELLRALETRRAATVKAMARAERIRRVSVQGRLAFRLTSRLGAAHPFELGFMWHPTLGVPYLPGSGLKGAVRFAYWARYVAEQGDQERERGRDYMRLLFGTSDDPDDITEEGRRRRGLAVFFDVFPPPGARVAVDILNPHFPSWYQETGAETDDQNPVPNFFLAVEGGGVWQFDALLVPGSLAVTAEELDECEKRLRQSLEDCVFAWGVGAKTAAGYGIFARAPENAGAQPTEGKREREQEAPGPEWVPPAPASPALPDPLLDLLSKVTPADFGRLQQLIGKAEGHERREEALQVLGRRLQEIYSSDKRRLRDIRTRFPSLAPYLGL